jgi:hypothetical protein
MSHDLGTVIRDFRPEDRAVTIAMLASSFQGVGPPVASMAS